MSISVTGTATDPLALADADTVVISAGGATGLRTLHTSFYETRVNFGNPVETPPLGPDLTTADPFLLQRPIGPVTLGHTYIVSINCNIVGVRIYKHPNATGNIEVRMWSNAGIQLATKSVVWTADAGGWRTVTWTTPVALTAGQQFDVGYYYPTADDDYAMAYWVWNGGLDMYAHPFLIQKFSSGSGTKTGGSWNKQGTGITWSGSGLDRQPADYYIDPIAEWQNDLPAYTGPSYWNQWVNGPDYSSRIPIAVWWPNANRIAEYAPIGINTIIGDYGYNDDYIAAIKSSGLEWWPFLHGDDMSAVIAVQEDPALGALVTGYFVTDEPDVVRPYASPTTVMGWRNHARSMDSTRPMWLNLSRYVLENQGFTWQPVNISAWDANMQWREYAELTDIASLDAYSINATYPFNANTSEENRYGIWTYPLQIQHSKKMVDGRCPAWGVVETTSSIPNKPTTTEVKKATWALLIGGATGIEYFQHRFADADVTQDFATLVNTPAMASAVTDLNAQIQSLAAPILAPEANLVTSVASSNTTDGPVGGVYGVPIHYTSRQVGGTNYLFTQGIRPGTTTGTFTVPSAAGKTLTVIGEARTVVANGSGAFTDTFAADYTYHLYSWTP